MYIYTAQGKIEHFGADYGPLIDLTKKQVSQEQISCSTCTKVLQELVKQELFSNKQVSQEQLLLNAIKTQLSNKIVSTKEEVPCVISNANDRSEIMSRCGKCCQDVKLTLNQDTIIDKTKNICYCDKFNTSREKNTDITYKSDYLETTKSSSGVFKPDSKITSADICRDLCLLDDSCSYSIFNDKNKLCYHATANPLKGVKQERIDQIIDYKKIPNNIETVSSARYYASPDIISKQQAKMTSYKNLSLPNCAQKCINDTSCKFANANMNLDCDLWTLPLKFASPQNDFGSVTLIQNQ